MFALALAAAVPTTGSTKKKKRKRTPSKQAIVDATAAKRAAIAAEAARGPLPTKRHYGEGPFAPQLMPEGLFDSDRPGERWAAHFDYSPSEVLVSSLGAIRVRGGHAAVGEYETFTIGSQTKKGYRVVNICGKQKRIHILVCEAFHGPKPDVKGVTVDHIAKYDGDFMLERSDNRACNLRWATPKEQIENQKEPSANSTGVPVLARKAGSTDDADWVWYASANAAGNALGIGPSHIGDVCNGKGSKAKGYVFKIDTSSLEDQEDLPAEELGSAHARFCVATERWKVDPKSDGRTRVSTRGRVQTRRCGGGWTQRRTPRATAGTVYATVSNTGVHLVVWRTFRPNDPPINDETMDHIDQDTSNNSLYNLRRATKSQQARNRTSPSADDIVCVRKPVLAWKDGASIETAERFVGMTAAARALNERFGTTKFLSGNISKAASTKCKCNGWRFAFEPEPAEAIAAREAERQRVLAAIAALRRRRKKKNPLAAESDSEESDAL